MTRNYWSVIAVFLCVLIILLTASSQGFSRDGVQETTFDSQNVDLSSKKSIDRREQEPQKHLEEEHNIREQSYSGRLRRNIVDDAKETVQSTTDSLVWVKKNLRYLLLMAGSIFFLFFSCMAYRRLTRDSGDDEDDDVKVIVIGGPQKNSSCAPTPPPPPPPEKKSKNQNKKTTNARIPTPKGSTKPSTKTAKEIEKIKSTKLKGGRKRKDLNSIENKKLNTRDDGNHDSDVSFSDFVNVCATEDENMISQSEESLFGNLLNQNKNPLPRIKLTACVMNDAIPFSSYTSFQQVQESEVDLNVSESATSQYLDKIRAHAECLNAKKRVTHGNTSNAQYPVLDDVEVNQRLVTSVLERCGQYYPKASTITNLPITAESN